MKKLIAFVFCLAVLTTVARAEYPKQTPGKNAAMQKSVEQQVEQAQLEKRLEVDVVMSVQTQQYDSGNLKTTYICKGVIINTAGDVAIKKDCMPALNLAEEFERNIALNINMKKLGTYKSGEYAGDGFFYETDDAQPRTFAIAKDFIVYALPIKNSNSEVKASLSRLFKGKQALTAQRVNVLLNAMPKAQVKKELLRNIH